METIRGSWRAKLLDPELRGRPDFRQIINRALQKAKDDYKTTYLNLHKKARLGINEDEKKKELLKDPRLDQLKKLARDFSSAPRLLDRASDPPVEAHALLHAGQGRPGRLADLPALQLPPPGGDLGASGQAVLSRSTTSSTRCWRTGARPSWTISPTPR